uniref:Uncharacterized protein n=1 Tax=Picea sitchensis TaxID=3332 RepID=D5A9P3_PICSI|nr:unknown [Picea sitchensis]
MRERARTSIELMTSISGATMGFFENLADQASKFQQHIEHSHEVREQSIIDFQKAYEAQSRQEEQQLINDISNLVANAMVRKADMVNTRLSSLREKVIEDRESMQQGILSIDAATSDAKRKWETFAKQADNDANESAALSAAKHCRMELLLQQCVNITSNASQHWKTTKKTGEDHSRKYVTVMESLVRDGVEANDKHDAEIDDSRVSAEVDIEKNNESILLHVDSSVEHEHKVASEILSTIEAHSHTLEKLQNDHLKRVTHIEEQAEHCFCNEYMEDQPTSTTPSRQSIEIPSRDLIENMRAPPFEALVEEFRENNPHDVDLKIYHENGISKESKPRQDSLIPRDSRSPLTQVN